MTEHYFSEAPSGSARQREIEVMLAGAARTLVTSGGVFSPEHLDDGTAILLKSLPRVLSAAQVPEGPVIDVGCGWGPIALDAALTSPERDVWAIDVNERSRQLTALNATRLGLERVRVAAPEEVPADLRFAEIRSNPPIRVGKPELHRILSTWLPRLLPGGVASLVVAKHLGAESLQRWIAAEFPTLTVDRADRDRGFHVIRAVAQR